MKKINREVLKHWYEIRKAQQNYVADYEIKKMMRGTNCAYCQKYFASNSFFELARLVNSKCCGCPIRKLTGQSHCKDTPWQTAFMCPITGSIDEEIAFLEMVVGLDECGALEGLNE